MIEAFERAVADQAQLRAALEASDIAPQLMVLVHLTGDTAILDEVAPHIHGPWNFMEKVPSVLKAKVRAALVDALQDCAEGRRSPSPVPNNDVLRRMMQAGVGQLVPDEYIPLILEETALGANDPRSVAWREKPAPEILADFKVLIIGAGFSGLGMAIKLQEAGLSFEIIEKNETVGGTWFENGYPGCGVDTPNHFFSYSFEPNHDWPEHFSKRDELWSYIERCADKYDLRRNIRFKTEMTGAHYDPVRALWHVTLKTPAGRTETRTVNALITAVGQLNRPAIPDIPGLKDFEGPAFHTGHWDHNQTIKGKRLAMIGTGASGMQTAPSIAPDVAHLTVFQRTPHWAVANPNYHAKVSDGKKWALRNIPFYANWYRFQLFWASSDGLHPSLQIDPEWQTPDISLNAQNQQFRDNLIAHMTKELDGDPELLKKVVPPYPPYGKRMLRDNHWYKMLKRPNVALVTDPIEKISADAVHTRDGKSHPVDMIVLATGFQAGRMLWPMEIRGATGQSLREIWGDDNPRAHLGITVPDFPNLFMLYGPNTNLGHGGSAIFHSECQIRYIMLALREMIERGAVAMNCRHEPHDAYNARVDAAHAKMVWSHGGVGNWYKNKAGRVIANSPWRLVDYWSLTKSIDPNDYIFQARASQQKRERVAS
jgi:4-hydroxyacetophenone monooxygenase